MKSFQVLLLVVVVAMATAFTPSTQKVHNVASLQMANKLPTEPVLSSEQRQQQKNAVAAAAFATAVAPFAANAATVVDEGTIIGYGAGLVACVVSLAVGFAIGYGTLVKP